MTNCSGVGGFWPCVCYFAWPVSLRLSASWRLPGRRWIFLCMRRAHWVDGLSSARDCNGGVYQLFLPSLITCDTCSQLLKHHKEVYSLQIILWMMLQLLPTNTALLKKMKDNFTLPPDHPVDDTAEDWKVMWDVAWPDCVAESEWLLTSETVMMQLLRASISCIESTNKSLWLLHSSSPSEHCKIHFTTGTSP